jgi:hypothetical protein
LTRASATGGIGGELDRAGKQSAALRLGRLPVPYQPIWYDFDVLVGAYTPKQLRRAGKVVRPWGPVQHYLLP